MNRLFLHTFQALQGLLTGRVRVVADAIPFVCQDVPRRKVLNAILAESSCYVKPLSPWGWPTHLMMEPASICNLHCTLCPVTAGLGRPQGLMAFETFKQVVDEVGDYVFTLLLWGWGEPFLNPQVFEMIAYARARGITVISSTNGHLFAREEFADRLVRSGLDSIIFAIDGATQDTYARFRQGGSLETALTGLRTVAARKKALKSKTPFINLRYIVMAQNEAEIPLVKKWAPSIGANALTFKTLNPDIEDPYSPLSGEVTGGTALEPKDQRYRRFRRGRGGEPRVRRRRNPCKHLWTHPVIHWNGTVVFCSYDPCEKYPLGTVQGGSLRDIWTGEAYQHLRRQFRDNRGHMPLCGDCSYAWKGGACSHETIAEAIFYRPETGDG
jgi:radical SAM protein with 4Fe4S-binding SPASM domain